MKLKKLTSIILAMALLAGLFSFRIPALAASEQISQTIFACADGYYNTSGGVMSWVGDIDKLGVSNTGTSPYRMTYLKFDMSQIKSMLSQGYQISKATVTLTAKEARSYSTEGSDGYLSLYSITDDSWTEDGTITPAYITAENQAELCVSTDPENTSNNYILIPDGGAQGDQFTLDITNHVAKSASDEADSYISLEASWVVERKGGNTFNFHSRENSNDSNKPQLYVEYTLGSESDEESELLLNETLSPTDDGGYDAYDPSDPEGTWTNAKIIRVSNGGALTYRVAYVKFDLSTIKENLSKGMRIKNASLRLQTRNSTESNTANGWLSLYRIDDDSWSEDASSGMLPTPITARNARETCIYQNPDNPDMDYLEIAPDTGGTEYILDITNAVRAEALRANDDFLSMELSYRLKRQSLTFNFSTKEDGAEKGPQLLIEYAPSDGVDFCADEVYYSHDEFDSAARTLEASVLLKRGSASSGVIASSIIPDAGVKLNFEIIDGAPAIRLISENSEESTYIFDTVNVCRDEWLHLALTLDSSVATLYTNGEPSQTISVPLNDIFGCPTSVFLGGDSKDAAANNYFKGYMRSFVAYSDVRTPEEVKDDFAKGCSTDADILGSYTLKTPDNNLRPAIIADTCGDGTYFEIDRKYIYEEIPIGDYAYSFAIVPDTQKVAISYPGEMEKIYDYILDNAERFNTKFVIGLGDITDGDSAHEWAVAKSQIDRLNGRVPFSIVRGNHDSEDMFVRTFPYKDYKNTISGSYDASMLSTYHKFKVGNVKYLILNLDYLPTDDELAWACEVVEANPDYNVIITTHSYLQSYLSVETTEDVRYEHGETIWQTLAGAYENVVMVLCGHSTSHDITLIKENGVCANTVAQLRIDGQDYDVWDEGAGLVAMFHFSEDGKNVDVRYYSAIKEAYFYNENQFGFTLDVVESEDDSNLPPKINGGQVSINVSLDGYTDGKIYAALYNESNHLLEANVYDAAQTLDISFSEYPSGSSIKIFWWDGESLNPITNPNILNMNISN